MDLHFDYQKKIVLYGRLIKDTSKRIEFRILTITQFATDSPSGEKVEIVTDITHRIPKNWIFTIRDTGRKSQQRSRRPPKVITIKYRYHGKIIPKLLQKHHEWLKQSN